MEKLDARQKQLVIEKMRELKAKPELLAKYDKDGDGVVSAEEWEAARRDVVRKILRNQSSRVFQVAPILKKQNRDSGMVLWMYDHRDMIGAILITCGSAMILTDPGTFAERAPLPYAWGEMGTTGDISLAIIWLNWTSSGWTGLLLAFFGVVWSRFANFFMD
ncbi:MAG: hypothetical protein HQK86_05035 [Nitrospinae bacterium]|nr:hypothetical protein [Nitrospinota bacterium]